MAAPPEHVEAVLVDSEPELSGGSTLSCASPSSGDVMRGGESDGRSSSLSNSLSLGSDLSDSGSEINPCPEFSEATDGEEREYTGARRDRVIVSSCRLGRRPHSHICNTRAVILDRICDIC